MMLTLCLLPDRYGIIKLPAGDALPGWLHWSAPFVSVTRTEAELSIMTRSADIPDGPPGFRDLRLFAVAGPLATDAVGIMHGLTAPLAAAAIWILAVSSHDTDFLAVREADLAAAQRALGAHFRLVPG